MNWFKKQVSNVNDGCKNCTVDGCKIINSEVLLYVHLFRAQINLAF